jgi:hypothetical protein
MTAKEKAFLLYKMYEFVESAQDPSKIEIIECCKIAVEEIKEVAIDMDFWNNVLIELNNLKSNKRI